jgi:hypothetical protein
MIVVDDGLHLPAPHILYTLCMKMLHISATCCCLLWRSEQVDLDQLIKVIVSGWLGLPLGKIMQNGLFGLPKTFAKDKTLVMCAAVLYHEKNLEKWTTAVPDIRRSSFKASCVIGGWSRCVQERASLTWWAMVDYVSEYCLWPRLQKQQHAPNLLISFTTSFWKTTYA